jgi:hypothetical protein
LPRVQVRVRKSVPVPVPVPVALIINWGNSVATVNMANVLKN